ncbi:hypothetical protein AYO38_01375 [bacterium SCGC AG-212-C10]|nr:hypothetical protein AYO38_01375 [bacterium SCGC AG-212-C10]
MYYSPMRLSVLDLVPVPAGGDSRTAMRNMLELARETEALGYTRYWIAEHHGSPRLGASAPEVLIAAVAAATSTMRVGSGAVLLPYYSPVKVAEVFSTLNALYPGRIDLGLGRGRGASEAHAAALGRAYAEYSDRLIDLLAFLTGGYPEDHPYASVEVHPVCDDLPDTWLLGSTVESASLAAEMGLPFAFALFVRHEDTATALRTYREQFAEDAMTPSPQTIIAVEVTCAATDRLAASLSVESGDEALPASAEQMTGSPKRLGKLLRSLVAETGADEVMISTLIDDHAARLRSYRLLARELL